MFSRNWNTQCGNAMLDSELVMVLKSPSVSAAPSSCVSPPAWISADILDFLHLERNLQILKHPLDFCEGQFRHLFRNSRCNSAYKHGDLVSDLLLIAYACPEIFLGYILGSELYTRKLEM